MASTVVLMVVARVGFSNGAIVVKASYTCVVTGLGLVTGGCKVVVVGLLGAPTTLGLDDVEVGLLEGVEGLLTPTVVVAVVGLSPVSDGRCPGVAGLYPP